MGLVADERLCGYFFSAGLQRLLGSLHSCLSSQLKASDRDVTVTAAAAATELQ